MNTFLLLVALTLLLVLLVLLKMKEGPMKFILNFIILFCVLAGAFMLFSVKHIFNTIEKSSSALDESEIIVNDGLDEEEVNNYKQIALFGVDSRTNDLDQGSRSDCIMVLAVHKKKHTIRLMSVYRDTYVSIKSQDEGEEKYDKINAAYAYGGPTLAITTLNRNLDLNIKDYVTVNFKALVDVVDTVGGIELEIKSEKELTNINNVIKSTNHLLEGKSEPIPAIGTYSLDGIQALAYARVRYMEGGDHERAHHQRIVCMKLLDKLKENPWIMKDVVNTVLPNIKTNLSAKEIEALLIPVLFDTLDEDSTKAYPLISKDMKYHGVYYGFPTDVRENVKEAHLFLFNTSEYKPTIELEKIADTVKKVTQ